MVISPWAAVAGMEIVAPESLTSVNVEGTWATRTTAVPETWPVPKGEAD